MGLPVIGLIAGLAGTAVQAIGAIGQGEAAAANANYQAQVARNNAEIARQNAVLTEQAGSARAAAQGLKAKAAIGQLVATQGANGVDVGSGSNLDVKLGAEELADLDTKTLMSNAVKQAYGERNQAVNYEAQATLDTQEAGQAKTAGVIGGLGSFLSGVSSVGKNWLPYQASGTGGAAAGYV